MAKGIYSDMPGIDARDYVVSYRADRKTWSVDRVGAGGTHTTIGSTRGFGTTEAVRKAIEHDAHVKGVRNATVHNEGGEAGVLKDGRVYFFPGAFANDGYEHKVREAPRSAPADETAARELVMFIENESDLSPDGPRGQGRDVLLNALRKWRKGTYDPTLAIKLFGYLVESGAKRYAKEFGSSEREWSTMFPPATRQEAARQLEASFRDAAEGGNYDQVDVRTGAASRGLRETDSREPLYHVVAINERTGRKEYLTSKPVTHREGVEILRKQRPHRDVRKQLEPVVVRGRHVVREASRGDDRPISMTYGELPPFEQFEQDIRRPDPDHAGHPYWPQFTLFPMELVGAREIELAERYGLDEFEPERARSGRNSRVRGFQGDEGQLYGFLKYLVEQLNDGDDEAGDLASSIMTTLGYEWI